MLLEWLYVIIPRALDFWLKTSFIARLYSRNMEITFHVGHVGHSVPGDHGNQFNARLSRAKHMCSNYWPYDYSGISMIWSWWILFRDNANSKNSPSGLNLGHYERILELRWMIRIGECFSWKDNWLSIIPILKKKIIQQFTVKIALWSCQVSFYSLQ